MKEQIREQNKMIKELLLTEELFDAMERGEKWITIRNGKRNVCLGELTLKSSKTGRTKIVDVWCVYYSPLEMVYIEDIQEDGFEDHDFAINTLKTFYPKLKMTDDVTVIKWESH